MVCTCQIRHPFMVDLRTLAGLRFGRTSRGFWKGVNQDTESFSHAEQAFRLHKTVTLSQSRQQFHRRDVNCNWLQFEMKRNYNRSAFANSPKGSVYSKDQNGQLSLR